jgi:hypothetical protein
MNANLREACSAGDAQRIEELVAAGTLEVVDLLLSMSASFAAARFGHDVLQVVVSDDESAFEDGAERPAAARKLIEYGAPLD